MDYENKNKDAISTIKQALRQLATNGVPVGNMIKAINDIEEKYAESEDERIRKAIIEHFKHKCAPVTFGGVIVEDALSWLEKQGENNMGISEATKQKLEDNLNKALEKETPESWNKFLDEQGEQKPAEWSIFDYRTWQYIVSDVLTKKDGIGQYLDNGECKKIAKYMQEEWSKRLSVEQRTTELPKGEDYGIDGLYAAIDILQKTLGEVEGYQSDDGILEHKCAISAVKELSKQKPTDKIGLKFHEGDWVVISTSDGEKVVQIDSIEYFKNGKPRYITSEGRWFSNGTEARLWNIAKEAKDGDVLVASDGSIFIFKGTINCACKHYIALATDGAIEINEGLKHYWETSRAVHPATKEQRDTIMKAMADAGYTFNFEKKELKEIVSPIFHIGDRVRYKGHACDGVITEITDTDYICGNAKLPISTQDKLELVEQNHACSDVDDKMYNNLTEFEKAVKQVMEEAIECGDTYNLKADADMLLRLVQKPAWSEEDENGLSGALWAIKQARTIAKDENDMGNLWYAERWLKSLKDRFTWKPSDEQMDALDDVIDEYDGYPEFDSLVSLKNDLKKLREEKL